jgi:hypothetical protein
MDSVNNMIVDMDSVYNMIVDMDSVIQIMIWCSVCEVSLPIVN